LVVVLNDYVALQGKAQIAMYKFYNANLTPVPAATWTFRDFPFADTALEAPI
jgi:hypothetical protein